MTEFLSYGFAQRALAAGLLVALMCAVLAFFVVLRRMAFVGAGVAHAALGGVALGLVVGIPPLLGALFFSIGTAWLIGWVSERGGTSEETAIGILFPAAMALGVVLISFSATYRQDLVAYLFGSILAVRPADLWLLSGLAVVTLGVLGLFFKEFVYMSIDEEGARAAGIPVTVLHYLLLMLMAVTIVAAIKLVGIVLVAALLVVPAATGQIAAGSMRGMLFISVFVALVSVGGGLWLSWVFNLPSGAAIVLLAAAIFFAAHLLRS